MIAATMAKVEQVLHGREASLGVLRTSLDAAIGGRGRLVLLSGEAGIGKSALATAIGQEAQARGAEVVWGRAWEFAEAPPYFPVWPGLRALGVAIESHESSFALWERVLAAMVSASRPLVWIVEDLHAADLGTLDLLTFLTQPLRATRVLIVATTRAQDPRLTDRMLQRLARIARDGGEVKLDPLSGHEIAAVAEDALGRPVEAATLRRLVELTGGNPLFVVECLRAIRAAGTLGRIPSTVSQVVVDRVALLSAATREALAFGAVLGREFSAATVARMLGSLPARVIDTLLPALRAGIVREASPGQFIYSHMLVRDAVAETLGADERASIHAKAAAALAGSGDAPEVLVERARHAVAALPHGDAAQALQVADRATALLEAERAFDRAADLHDSVEAARSIGLLPAASPERRLHVAQIARSAGRSEVCRRICEQLIVAARAASDAPLLARTALLHAADVRPNVIDRSQVALLEEARAMLGDREPTLICRVLARLATAMQPSLDQTTIIAIGREAISRAQATGDDEAIRDVRELATWGLYAAPLPERVANVSDLLERALAARDLPKAMSAYIARAFYWVEGGDFAAFDRDVANALALADDVDHPRHRWRALLLASCRATAQGRFTESDEQVAEVAQLAALIDDPALPFALALHDVLRLKIMRRDDELKVALDKLEDALRDAWRPGLFLACIKMSCAARTNDLETARPQLDRVRAEIRSEPAWFSGGDPFLMGFAGEAFVGLGTDEERRHARMTLAASPLPELSGDQVSFTYEGSNRRLLGLLDASLGDLASAERELRAAHALATSRGHLALVAQLAYDLAKVLRARGGIDEPRALFEESARIAREIGMVGLQSTTVDVIAADVTTMEREGDVWKVTRGANVVRVKDSRGLQLLARLVERPNEDLHVLALASDEGVSAPESNAGAMLDDRAIREYRQRLLDLDEALAAAESAGDARAATRLEREKDALVAELARATGLGGRSRQSASATERARINVQRRLKDAIARITEADGPLGKAIERCVRTGTFCSFRP